MTLSVAIVTLNEEANLARTLAGIAWADQIVVVDSGSTDNTIAIAHSFNATVIEHAWQGFAAQKNFAIAQCTGDWILSLDADEELTPDLQREIQTVLAAPPVVDAYYLKRRNLFLNRWMRHGGFYPDAKLRLFRRGSLLGFKDRAVHEIIEHTGPTATLAGDLIHHAYPTLSSYMEHMNRYSTLGAEVLLSEGSVRTSLPAFLFGSWLAPAFMFVKNYILRGGFLDGSEGYLLHRCQAQYSSWKYLKAYEKQQARKKVS
jgi:glycosyltransferase involved in cell wall biosynthesis